MNRFLNLTALLFAGLLGVIFAGAVTAQVPNLPTPDAPSGPAPIPAAPVLGATSYILQDFHSQQIEDCCSVFGATQALDRYVC